MKEEMLKDVREEMAGNCRQLVWYESSAIATVEVILIVVVLISLVILFKGQLTSLVTSILEKITTQGNSV